MSNELYAFLTKESIPSQTEWQNSINKLGFNLKIDAQLKPFEDSGFSPCKINGRDSGFEIGYEASTNLFDNFSEIGNKISDRDWCISFRWGGDLNELACVLIASASLVTSFNALVYDPDSSVFYEKDDLLKEIHKVIQLL
jgi:hypothetical protein